MTFDEGAEIFLPRKRDRSLCALCPDGTRKPVVGKEGPHALCLQHYTNLKLVIAGEGRTQRAKCRFCNHLPPMTEKPHKTGTCRKCRRSSKRHTERLERAATRRLVERKAPRRAGTRESQCRECGGKVVSGVMGRRRAYCDHCVTTVNQKRRYQEV